MASRLVRKRGMEPPYAVDQISACILHPIISTGFVVLSALSLELTKLGLILAPFVLLNIVVIAFWGYISWTDPAGEGGCVLRTKGADTPHYCNYCRKTVKGFDHHCSWLNTCISKRNYAHFYLLGVSGSLLYLYMSAVALLAIFVVDKDDLRDAFGSLTAARAGWGVFLVVSGWTAVSFVALAGFHTYLLLIGLGTFDWVVSQNQKRQEKLAARRNAPADGSKFRCCGGKDGHRAATAPSAASSAVRDGGKASASAAAATGAGGSGYRSPSSRTNTVLAPGTGARGGWGGAGMGVGVTPTRSRGGSNALKAHGTPAGSAAINSANGSSKLKGVRGNSSSSVGTSGGGVDRLEP